MADRYAPSRMLSFDIAHVFKAFQLMEEYGRISRALLLEEMNLGGGSIKTLVKHLKMHELVETSNGGMWMSDKGRRFYSKLAEAIPNEMNIPKCSIGLGKYNHVILLKELESEIGSGIEQRDAAIKMGAAGASTFIYKEGKFFMPGRNQDSLKADSEIRKSIVEIMHPKNKDVIIIVSAENKKVAEFAAKNTALQTVANHHKHI